MEIVNKLYWWSDLKEDLRAFTQSCIHCTVVNSGLRILRSLSVALHASKPNEVVHADFLYVGLAESCEIKYVLLSMDDISSYTWLYLCANADSDAATNVLSK